MVHVIWPASSRLLALRIALTANHCCLSTDPSQYIVYHNTLIDGGFQRILVKEIIQHEDYNEDFFIVNDICILKTELFVINDTVQPACLGKIMSHDYGKYL